MAEQDSDASEKTEEPSQYKLEESRRKGEVSYSREIVSVLVLSACLFSILVSSVYMFEIFQEYINWLFKQPVSRLFETIYFYAFVKKSILTLLKIILPVILTSFVIGIASHLSQIGFIFAPEVLTFNFTRINPVSGFKRIFSSKSLFEAFKAIIKFSLVITISVLIIKDNIFSFLGFLNSDLSSGVEFAKSILIKNSYFILIGLGVLAAIDFAWERYTYMKKMKMTKREQKEEMKEREGNPEIKQKIKTMQKELARKRMMSEIKTADAIVANPTHFSVAIKYDKTTMLAPRVVAKGVDHLALKIREIARDHEIPVVENVKLARSLYFTVDVGEEIPKNLYKAVAEILAYVYKLRRKIKALSRV